MLTELRLETAAGEYVTTVVRVPTYDPPPGVVILGARSFTLHRVEDGDDPAVYREAFAWYAVNTEDRPGRSR